MTLKSDMLASGRKPNRLFPTKELNESYFKEDTPSGADCTKNYYRSSRSEEQPKNENSRDNGKFVVKKIMLWR